MTCLDGAKINFAGNCGVGILGNVIYYDRIGHGQGDSHISIHC